MYFPSKEQTSYSLAAAPRASRTAAVPDTSWKAITSARTSSRSSFAICEARLAYEAGVTGIPTRAGVMNTAQGGTTNVDAYDRYLRWRQLFFSEYWDEENDRQRVQLARGAVALDPGFVLGWDALARSLDALANEIDESKTQARFDNGVLTLTLPKRAAAGGKKITIS